MSTQIILYGLLVTGVTSSLVGARLGVAIRGAIKVSFGMPAVIYIAAAGLTSLVLWVWLAIETGYWQLAAMSIGQFLITHAANLGAKGAKS